MSATPFDFVDLFLNLERLEVVELWLVRLELGMEFVLASFFLAYVSSIPTLVCTRPVVYRFVPLEQHHTATFVTRCKVIARLVKLNGRDDIRCACCQHMHTIINALYRG